MPDADAVYYIPSERSERGKIGKRLFLENFISPKLCKVSSYPSKFLEKYPISQKYFTNIPLSLKTLPGPHMCISQNINVSSLVIFFCQ